MKSRSNPFLVASIALVSATTLQAATLYWDGTDTTADADGGAGNWDTVLTSWDDAATAGNPVAWPSSGTDNDAVFGGTAGNVTIDAGGVTANDVTFNTVGYLVAGDTLTLNGAANILSATTNSSTPVTISAPLVGTSGFTKTGSGQLLLNGTNTGLSGIITLPNVTGTNNAGLTLSGASSAGGITQIDINGTTGTDGQYLSLANVTLASTVTLNLSGQGGNSAPVGTLRASSAPAVVDGPVNLLTPNVRISSSGTGSELRINGKIDDGANSFGASFRFGDGNGVYLTNTTNDWGGDTISTGILRAEPGAIPATSRIIVGASGNGWFQTYGTLTRPLGNTAGSGAMDLSTNSANRILGFSARGGALAVNLGGAASDIVWGSTVGFNPAIFGFNNSTADSAISLANPLDLNGANRVVQVDANTATLNGGLKNSSATAAGLRKTGAGTLAHDPGALHTVSLQSVQTGAGTFEIKSGTLTLTSGASTTYSVAMNGFTVVGGSTFRLSGGTVNVQFASGSVFTAGHTTGGSGNFIQDGGTFDAGGREILNAYGAGGTATINDGTFICGAFRVGQNVGVLNLNGGTLRANNLSTGGGTTTVNFNGGTLQAKTNATSFVPTTLTNTVVRAGGAIIDSNSFNVTIAHALTEDSGSTGGGLTKKGGGILDLTGTNTYTGTNLIQGGVLRVSDNLQLGDAVAPVTVNGGEFGVAGTSIASLSSLARTFTYTTGGFHVADATHTLDVDIALTGSAALSKSGPGVITLSGVNDFTGGITMGSGNNGWIEVDSATDLGTGVKIANMASSSGSSVGGIRLLNNVTVSDVALNLAGRNTVGGAATQHALLNVSGNNVWEGDINIVNSGGTYYLRSEAGQLELSGTLSNAQVANVTADTRIFNLEGPGDYLISGTIADGVNANRFTGLLIEGSGTATLTGTNTYTGPTSVKTGTLALVGGSQTSPITVDSGATLGFTLGSSTTSTSTVTFSGATAKVKVTGTPVAATLLTTTAPSGITGAPVLDPAIPGFSLAIEDGGTTLKLIVGSASNYDTWATTNGVPGQAANLDHDNDGVSNGVEYFIGGPTGNTTGFTPVPSVTTTAGVSSITWTKAATYTGVYNTDYFVETSTSLATGSWATEASPGTVTISGNNVTYTFPAGPVKNFARLKVTGP